MRQLQLALLMIFFVPFAAHAYLFTRQLEYGDRGPDISALQDVLKDLHFFTYPNSTGFFGALTQSAVQKFQAANGIASFGTPITTGYGRVGPQTLNVLNSFNTKSTPSGTSTSAFRFSRNLSVGMYGMDVYELQRFLNAHQFPVAQTGPGSSGNETLWFLEKTRHALASAQASYGIQPAVGFFGPITRAKFNELLAFDVFKQHSTSSSSVSIATSTTAASTSTTATVVNPGRSNNRNVYPGGSSIGTSASTPNPTQQIGFSVGVNLDGLEFGNIFPGVAGTNYQVPTNSQIDYYYTKGVAHIRIPFKWERIQPALQGSLDATYLGYIKGLADHAASKGMVTILDVHNYGGRDGHKLGDGTLTNADFADLWTKIAAAFAGYGANQVVYDIMNEPSNMPSTSAWPSAAQAAIDAIRAVDTQKYIYIEGDGWSSAYAWVNNNDTLYILNDPSDRLVFSAHTYADRDSSGTHFVWNDEVAAGDALDNNAPLTTDILVKRLTPFVNWLHAHNLRGHIGELGVGNDDIGWLETMDRGYAFLQQNGIPISQFAGGLGWGSYAQSVEPGKWLKGYPATIPTSDAAQMAVMTKYTGAPQPTVYFLTGPQQGTAGIASTNFTIAYRGNLSSPIVITPNDSGAGGTFTPTTVTLSSGIFNPTATFTYTAPSSPSSVFTIRVTNNAGLTNPPNVGYSTVSDRFSSESATSTLIFSLRRIFSPYVGPLVRLNRDSDNAQADFGQLADGSLDRQAILNWAQGSSVRLVTGYDQSNKTTNITTVTYGGNVGASTPRDYPGFILNDTDGHPSIYFDGKRRMDSANTINGPSQTWITRAKHVSGSRAIAWEFSNEHNFPGGSSPKGWSTSEDSPKDMDIGLDTSWHEYAGRWIGNTTNGKQSFKDGTLIAQQTTATSTLYSNVRDMLHVGWFVFGGSLGSGAWTGYLRELITFSGAAATNTITNISNDSATYLATPLPALTPLQDVSPYSTPTGWPALSTKLKGVNLSAAENTPGIWKTYSYDYTYPTNQEIDYYASKGFGLIRLPFDICRLYTTAYAPLNMIEMKSIKTVVDYAGSKGMNVLLDPHNFGNMCDSRISFTVNNSVIGVTASSTELFADFWSRMASLWKNYPNVVFGLMNEPHTQTAAQWQAAASTTVKAIRDAGFTGLITIPGTSFTGAHSWVSSGNAAAWAGYADPGNNFAFEMHQYLDSDHSGTHAPCTTGGGASRLDAATSWLATNGYKGLLGEFAWSTDPSCDAEGVALMNDMSSSSAQWIGWTWWAAGPWLGSYMFNLDPTSFSSPVDKPQMTTLLNYL